MKLINYGQILHIIAITFSIYFWIVETRPNTELFVSFLAIFVLVIGFFGNRKKNPTLLLIVTFPSHFLLDIGIILFIFYSVCYNFERISYFGDNGIYRCFHFYPFGCIWSH